MRIPGVFGILLSLGFDTRGMDQLPVKRADVEETPLELPLIKTQPRPCEVHTKRRHQVDAVRRPPEQVVYVLVLLPTLLGQLVDPNVPKVDLPIARRGGKEAALLAQCSLGCPPRELRELPPCKVDAWKPLEVGDRVVVGELYGRGELPSYDGDGLGFRVSSLGFS